MQELLSGQRNLHLMVSTLAQLVSPSQFVQLDFAVAAILVKLTALALVPMYLPAETGSGHWLVH